MPEEPPRQSRASTVQSIMTVTSNASLGIVDEYFDMPQMSFDPPDGRYGEAISNVRHGPYYMHVPGGGEHFTHHRDAQVAVFRTMLFAEASCKSASCGSKASCKSTACASMDQRLLCNRRQWQRARPRGEEQDENIQSASYGTSEAVLEGGSDRQNHTQKPGTRIANQSHCFFEEGAIAAADWFMMNAKRRNKMSKPTKG